MVLLNRALMKSAGSMRKPVDLLSVGPTILADYGFLFMLENVFQWKHSKLKLTLEF